MRGKTQNCNEFVNVVQRSIWSSVPKYACVRLKLQCMYLIVLQFFHKFFFLQKGHFLKNCSRYWAEGSFTYCCYKQLRQEFSDTCDISELLAVQHEILEVFRQCSQITFFSKNIKCFINLNPQKFRYLLSIPIVKNV